MCSRRGRRPYFAGRFVSPALPQWQGHPRNRKYAKRGRKRLFNAAIHALRIHVERTFAWEDKFKRLLLRFERIQQRHYGMKLIRKSP
jgi:transposase